MAKETRVYKQTVELIGDAEIVTQNEWADEVEVTLSDNSAGYPSSGEVLGVTLVTKSANSILSPAGQLVFFESAPTLSAGATALSAGDFDLIIGKINVEASDWITGTNGGVAYFNTPIAFQTLASFFVAWLHEDATQFNASAGHNDTLDLKLNYRLEN